MSAPAEGSANKPRRWLAVVLSLLCSGLGHAYAGFPLRGFAIVVGQFLVLVPLAVFVTAQPTLASLAVILAVIVAIYLLVVVDAARLAALPRTRFLRRGSVFLVCAGFLTALVPLQLAWEWWSHRELPQSYYAPSAAMLPTIAIGDHLFVDPRDYEPARGDIVVFRLARTSSGLPAPRDRNPPSPTESFIKRIVGVPGDSIRIEGAVLFVNGEPKTSEPAPETSRGPQGESIQVRPESLDGHDYFVWDQVERKLRSFETVVVEPDRYFMAGDHRDNSNDSRYWGTVHRDDIIGRATKIYWSWDNEHSWLEMLNPAIWWHLLRDKTRWDRIGMTIE